MCGSMRHGTAISQVFNFANFSTVCKNISMKFLTRDTLFSRSDCKSVDGQHPSAKLPSLQGTLSNPQSDIAATIQEQNVNAMYLHSSMLAS